MKRKLELGTDVLENPAKMLVNSENIVLTNGIPLAEHSSGIRRPLMASSPQTTVFCNDLRRQLDFQTSLRHPASQIETAIDPAREAELRRVINSFVGVYEQLDKTNDADVKPNYSYTELAFLAMLRSPNFCLPINEIYRYIQHRFQFYRNSTRKHWKNAVRHSLAKTMCFTKIAVGRGSSNCEKLSRSTYLWCIIPSSLACFARGDYRPSVDKESGTNTMRWGFYRVNAGKFWEDIGDYVANKMAMFRRLVHDSHTPGLVFEAQVCTLMDQPPTQRPVLQQRVAHELNIEHCAVNMISGNDMLQNRLKPELPNTLAKHSVGNPGLQNRLNLEYQRFSANHNSGNGMAQSGLKIEQCGETYGGSVSLELNRNLNWQHESTGQSYSQKSCDFGLERLQTPTTTDPWLPKLNIESPDTSLNVMEAERKTPPYKVYDSGFDTCDSSPEESSCRFQRSCNKDLASQCYPSDANVLSDSLLHDTNPLDLSPFSLDELTDFSFGCTQGQDANKENIEFASVVNDDAFQRFTATPPAVNQVTSPMTSDGRFTPITGFAPPTLPACTSTPFARQHQFVADDRVTPVHWQTTPVMASTPVLIVHPNGRMASVVLPHPGFSSLYCQV